MSEKVVEPDVIEVPESHRAEPPKMDMQLTVYEATPGTSIVTNIDDIIARAKEIAEYFQSFPISEAIDSGEHYREAKASRAEIRRISKSIDNIRKDVKRQYEAPLKAFEAKVKEATGPLDEADRAYKRAIDGYDEERSRHLESELRDYYYEASGDLGELVSYEDFMSLRAPKMRNGTYEWTRPAANLEKSRTDMEAELRRVREEWEALPAYDQGDLDRIRAYYCESLDMARTLTRIKADRDREEAIRRQREEQERWEREQAEAAARAEAERKAALERQHQEAEARAKAEEEARAAMVQPTPPTPVPEPAPMPTPAPTPAPEPILDWRVTIDFDDTESGAHQLIGELRDGGLLVSQITCVTDGTERGW